MRKTRSLSRPCGFPDPRTSVVHKPSSFLYPVTGPERDQDSKEIQRKVFWVVGCHVVNLLSTGQVQKFFVFSRRLMSTNHRDIAHQCLTAALVTDVSYRTNVAEEWVRKVWHVDTAELFQP